MVRKRRLGRTGLDVSEISLGTVELGMAYGIGAAKPTEQQAAALLHEALDLGVNLLDTARAYGDAEAIIGRNLSPRRDEYVLLSKVGTGTKAKVEAAVDASLAALQTDRIDVMLVHCGYGMTPDDETMATLLDCRAAGKLRFLGASVYGEEAALASIEKDWCDCVEIAWSALDRRPEKNTMPRAVERGVGVIARSVLLKGALTARSAALPQAFFPLTSEVERLSKLLGVAVAELPSFAYRYVLSFPSAAAALVGTAHASELKAALSAAEQGPLESELLEQIRASPLLPEEWLNPGRWPREDCVA